LESAISRPGFVKAYTPEEATAPRLAAEIAYGIIMNHPFPDGNKRTAFLVVNEYLRDAGTPLVDETPERIAADPSLMGDIGAAHDKVASNQISIEQLAQIYVEALSKK
jgi:prophage maintenance system killer protein